MFYVTPRSQVESIMKLGLLPTIGERSQTLGEAHAAVYLFVDATAVEQALSNWLVEVFDDDTPLSLLMVNVDGLDFVTVDPVAGYEARATQVIEVARLTLIHDDLDEAASIRPISSDSTTSFY